VDRQGPLPFLLPWPRLTLLIRRILRSQWDEATWPLAKAELAKALKLWSVVERRGGGSNARGNRDAQRRWTARYRPTAGRRGALPGPREPA
jgi:hypothetical protein